MLDNCAVLQSYEANLNGYIQSWVERFSDDKIHKILETIYNNDEKYFTDLI